MAKFQIPALTSRGHCIGDAATLLAMLQLAATSCTQNNNNAPGIVFYELSRLFIVHYIIVYNPS